MKAYLLRAMKAFSRILVFKFRGDDEDKRKTMRYSDSAMTRKKDEKFSLGDCNVFSGLETVHV